MARHVGAGSGPVGRGTFALGVLTTGLVTLAWTTNHFAKPLATLFGGAVTCGGLLLGLATDTLAPCRGRPRVFPLLHHPEYPLVFLTRGRRARPPATGLAGVPRP